MYLGATVQYAMESAGTTLKLCELNPERVLSPGEQEIRLMVAPKDVIILRK
jgi:hypothetical protein